MYAACPAHLIFDLVAFLIFNEGENYAAARYDASVQPSEVQTVSSAPCSQTPSF
jgi:hypothetical protein